MKHCEDMKTFSNGNITGSTFSQKMHFEDASGSKWPQYLAEDSPGQQLASPGTLGHQQACSKEGYQPACEMFLQELLAALTA